MNKKYKILLVAIIGIVTLSTMGNAAPIEEWNKTFGGPGHDIFNSVNQTKDGGYILAGNKIIKTDIYGNKIWEKIFKNTTFYSIKQTKDGGYIFVGDSFMTYSIINANIIKTDSLGNVQWKKIYGNYPLDVPSLLSIQQTKDGGYIAAGIWYIVDPWESDSNAWTIKTDSLGSMQWQNDYTFCLQCESTSIFESVQQTKDGGYLLAGETVGSYRGSGAWIVKMDFNGNKKWNKTFEYNKESFETMRSIAKETKDGGYIIIGGNSSYSWLIKTDSLGNKQWRKILQKLCIDICSIDGQQTKDGGYVITGSNIIIKTDAFGNIKWSKTTKIGDNIISVQQTKDEGYILAGKNNNDSARLIKLSADKYINILKNPGFEESYNSLPRYWNKYQTGTKAVFTYPETGRLGGKSVSIRYVTRETGKVALWSQSGIIVVPSKQYKLSGYMKLSNVTGGGAYPRYNGADLRINWYKSDGGLIKVDLITKSGTIGWARYEKTFTSPSNAVKATVGGDLFNTSGKVWYDDLSFVKVS